MPYVADSDANSNDMCQCGGRVLGVDFRLGDGQPARLTRAKIDSGVRAQAKDGGSIRVLITLMQQPQTETYRRAEARHQTSLDGATDRYMQAVHQGSVPDNVRTLAAVMDSIILATRQETFQEVRQQIQAEQDCLAARLAGLGATDIHR
jgi:hypothetical protein